MTGSLHMVLSNSAADKEAAFKELEDYGMREGQGAAARAGFYYNLVNKARPSQDRMPLDVSDAPVSWDRYAAQSAKGASMIGGMKHVEDDKKADSIRKVRVSETRQFLTMAGQPNVAGVEGMGRAMAIIKRKRMDGTLEMKPTDAMIAVARAQCNDEQNPLDDATIEIAIQPKEANEKTEADRLDKVRLELEAIEKKFGESDDVATARACVEQRIGDLGGTTKTRKAAAAAARKAAGIK